MGIIILSKGGIIYGTFVVFAITFIKFHEIYGKPFTFSFIVVKEHGLVSSLNHGDV